MGLRLLRGRLGCELCGRGLRTKEAAINADHLTVCVTCDPKTHELTETVCVKSRHAIRAINNLGARGYTGLRGVAVKGRLFLVTCDRKKTLTAP